MNIDDGSPIVLEISDIRTFQHLAFLIDRNDFRKDFKKYQPIVLSKHISSQTNSLSSYITEVPKEVSYLLTKYHYPEALAQAVLSAFLYRKITDEDVRGYKPKVGHPKVIDLRDCVSHPFDLRLDKKIKKHRRWYLLYQNNFSQHPKKYLGFRVIAKKVNQPFTTICSSVNAYIEKLKTPIIW